MVKGRYTLSRGPLFAAIPASGAWIRRIRLSGVRSLIRSCQETLASRHTLQYSRDASWNSSTFTNPLPQTRVSASVAAPLQPSSSSSSLRAPSSSSDMSVFGRATFAFRPPVSIGEGEAGAAAGDAAIPRLRFMPRV